MEKVVEIPKYSVFTVLVDIGSALGLWLGLSALDLLAGFIERSKLIVDKVCYKHIRWNVIKCRWIGGEDYTYIWKKENIV